MAAIRLPIETERLVIRPLRLADAEELHELYSDANAMRFLATEVPSSVAESREWVQAKIDLFVRDGGMSLWAVVERQSDAVVGDAGLQWEEIDGERSLDLACRIVPRRQGLGYGKEASQACLDAASSAGFAEVTAQTDTDNGAARRVLERLSFRYERETEWLGRRMALYRRHDPRTPRQN